MTAYTHRCHSCASPALHTFDSAESLKAISSDIQIVAGSIHLAICTACGLLQKCIDPDWQRAVDEVYRGYSINHQSGGADPYIFNSLYGAGPRADILVRHLQHERGVAAHGRLLDIGCGNGNILRGFAHHYPAWELSGIDGSGLWGETILGIPGVQAFHASLSELGPQKFDIIVMSHVLEHITNPASYLRHLHQYLSEDGLLFIAVPDIRQNPIDLCVLDHCTHFDEVSLSQVFVAGGFEVRSLRADVLGKEIVALSRVGATAGPIPKGFSLPLQSMSEKYLALCHDLLQAAREQRGRHQRFAIMGTSTAAAWLTAGLDMQVDFYVDEDPQRMGKQAFDKPIYSLADVPADSCVFIPMASDKARQIIARAQRPDLTFVYLPANDVSEATLRKS